MKSFEKEIKKRIMRIALFAFSGGFAIIIALFVKLYLTGSPKADTFLPVEILIGFFIGIEYTAFFRIHRYRKSLGSQESLEALHISETDERNRMIALKTCRSCIYSAFTLLGFAGIIASFINRVVFMTIGVILIALLVLYGILMIYYSQKYK